MELRKLKVHISWFFLMIFALGMADFSLHSLSHKHTEDHDSYHSQCASVSIVPAESSKIFTAEQECLRCGQFLVHTTWAIADLVSVLSPEDRNVKLTQFHYHLISNKLPSFFLRGPPKA